MAGDPISPVTITKPELTISAPAINNEPVELDGTPTSTGIKERRRSSKQDEASPDEQEVILKIICSAWRYADMQHPEEGSAHLREEGRQRRIS